MGSSSSRMRSRSPALQVNRTKPRKFSSLLCGCSSSHHHVEMEEYPAECSVNSVELCDPVISKVQKRKDELYLISGKGKELISSTNEAASSSGIRAPEVQKSSEVGTRGCEVSGQNNSLSKSKGLVPTMVGEPRTNDLNTNKGTTTSGTSFIDHQSFEPVSVHIPTNEVGIAANDISNLVTDGVSEIYPEVRYTSSSHPENERFGDALTNLEIVEGNSEGEETALDTSRSASLVSDLPVPFNTGRDDISAEVVSSEFEFPVFTREQSLDDEDIIHVDVLSISSGLFSSTADDSSNLEARWNGGRSFWDAFDRGPSSRGNMDSQSILFSTDDSDYLGSRERWLFGYSDLFSSDRVRDDPGYNGSRFHRTNERRRRRRFEIFDRLRYGLNENSRQMTFCPLGLHSDGACSCHESLTAEESRANASISRIVMLAEALFEVLDEIHRQPESFSLSMTSDTAPESVVNSFPLKNYRKVETSANGDSVEQCNICFAEYEDGDTIRVLPCQHEYHMGCVDKWLKEIHGVCPLCRGDVRGGCTDSSASHANVPYF